MVSLIVYLVVTVLAGLIISFILITMRSTKKRGDSAPYFTIFACLFLTIGGPFLADEIMTRLWGKEMEPAINRAYLQGPITGKMVYYRVIWRMGDKAKVFAVGQEKVNWGGTDQPIMAIYLEYKNGKWAPTEYFLLYSDRENKDSIVFPPYR